MHVNEVASGNLIIDSLSKDDAFDGITTRRIKDPVQTPCCKKIYHNDLPTDEDAGLNAWLAFKKTCPHCREPLTSDKLLKDKDIIVIKNELSANADKVDEKKPNADSQFVLAPCGHGFEKEWILNALKIERRCPRDDLPLRPMDLVASTEEEIARSENVLKEKQKEEIAHVPQRDSVVIQDDGIRVRPLPPDPEPVLPARHIHKQATFPKRLWDLFRSLFSRP